MIRLEKELVPKGTKSVLFDCLVYSTRFVVLQEGQNITESKQPSQLDVCVGVWCERPGISNVWVTKQEVDLVIWGGVPNFWPEVGKYPGTRGWVVY